MLLELARAGQCAGCNPQHANGVWRVARTGASECRMAFAESESEYGRERGAANRLFRRGEVGYPAALALVPVGTRCKLQEVGS